MPGFVPPMKSDIRWGSVGTSSDRLSATHSRSNAINRVTVDAIGRKPAIKAARPRSTASENGRKNRTPKKGRKNEIGRATKNARKTSEIPRFIQSVLITKTSPLIAIWQTMGRSLDADEFIFCKDSLDAP